MQGGDGKLNKRQKAFADEYIANGGNKYLAAIKAGYSKNYAKAQSHKLLENVGISEYINKRLKPIEKQREITADDALNELISIWQGETQTGSSKTIDHLKGNAVTKNISYEYTPDLENKIKALDLYLKYKSLLSQAQLEKAKAEIKLMQAKLEALQRGGEQSTEDKLDELLNRISGELDDA